MIREEAFEGPLAELEPLLGYRPAFDEQGACSLSAAGQLPVVLRRDLERRCLELSSPLGLDMPDSIGRGLFERLLTLSYDPGDASGVVGLDPEAGLPFVLARVPLQTLEPGEFPDMLDLFLAARDNLAREFAQAREAAGDSLL